MLRLFRLARAAGLVLALVLLAVAPAAAQTGINGEIQGKVVDSSGAVLPGVSVTLSGQSMMGTSVAVTDAAGSYRFPVVASGNGYKVQFELAGFGTVVRENIGVTVRNTTSLNVSLEIASLSESVTVSGQSPVVDTANARGGTTLTATLLQEIPTARDSFGLIAMASGAVRSSPSVAGSTADLTQSVSVNGSTASNYNVNGAETRAGAGNGRYGNMDAYEEVVVETGGAGADTRRPGGGFSAELIAKTGSNQFHGGVSGYWYNEHFVGDNLENVEENHPNSGLTESGDVKNLRDMVLSLGGPIMRDHVWFFASYREYYVVRQVLGREELQHGHLQPFLINSSIQTNSNNRFQVFWSKEPKKDTERALDRFVEYNASGNQQAWSLTKQVKYLRTQGQNTVIEAQAFAYEYWWPTYPQVDSGAPFSDNATGVFSNGENEQNIWRNPKRWQASASVSHYFGGAGASHDVKIGGDMPRLKVDDVVHVGNGPDMEVRYQTNNGAPSFATIDNGPFEPVRRTTSYSLYAQDRIARGRLTANLGVRYDYYRGWIPAQSTFPAGGVPQCCGEAASAHPGGSGPIWQLDGVRWSEYFPPTSYPEVKNALTWHNFSPRLSAVYQLTADGGTVIKGSFGFFPTEMVPEQTDFVNPNTLQTNRYRWRGDLNKNGVLDPATELGDLVATVRARNNSYADDYKNPNVREGGLAFERGLPRNVALRASYYYSQYVGTSVDTNEAIPTDSYTPVPYLDPGPDGVRGTADDNNITVYSTALTGSINVRSNYPGVQKSAHTVGVTFQKRLSNGWQFLGTYNFNRIYETTVGDLNNPNLRINEQGRSTLEAPHTMKFAGSYLFPKGVQVSATWSVQQGQPYNRTLNVTGLRQGSFSILADPTGTWRYDTQNQLDMRVEKQFRLAGGQMVGLQFEGYNLFNNAATTILGSAGVGSVTGGNFGQISHVVPPRTFRIGSRYTF